MGNQRWRALATKFAGGWCALLAGREAPIKPAPAAAATRVKPVGDEVVFGALVLSDVVQDGATIWSGVAPLLDHIGDSRAWCTDPPLPAPGDDPADDPAHEYVTDACNLNLLGPNLPGAVIECEWDDREFMGPIPADWPSHMCATVQELQAKSWQFRFSVVAPNSGEILAYTSPDVGPVLAAFFRRSADAEQGIQPEFLPPEFRDMSWMEPRPEVAGSDVYDFELYLHDPGRTGRFCADLFINVRVHVPTARVRFTPYLSVDDRAWAELLAPSRR